MDMLDIYTDYLICQNKYATATGLSDMVDGEFSHDKVTRFLRLGDFDSKMLWKYVKPAVRERETQNGVLILDDSIEDKPYTDENDVNCWHYSHAKGDVVKGINFLSCMIRYDDFSLPIGYEIIKKDVEYCDIKTKQHRRKATVNKNQHFRQLIQQACPIMSCLNGCWRTTGLALKPTWSLFMMNFRSRLSLELNPIEQ